MSDDADSLQLRDGRLVVLRPVQRPDLPAMNTLLMGLSPRSRRWRFHGAVNALPCTALRELTAPDDARHVTLVAEAPGSDGTARLVAEARWVLDRSNRGEVETQAEFALSVADDWQGLGLAHALLARLLERAHDAGLAMIYGSVLDDNLPMRRLMASLGARPRRDPRVGHGVVWCLETGSADSALPAQSPLGQQHPTLHQQRQ